MDMDMAEVRKYLGKLRNDWERHSEDNIFRVSKELENGMTYGQFTLAFHMRHHLNRRTVPKKKPSKPKKRKRKFSLDGTSSEDNSSDSDFEPKDKQETDSVGQRKLRSNTVDNYEEEPIQMLSKPKFVYKKKGSKKK